MFAAASLISQVWHVICSVAKAFANVAFTGSLLLEFALAGGIVWYSKRRPKDAPLSWGQAMVAAAYLAFANVAFTGSLLLSGVMTGAIIVYAKRRPKAAGATLTWGQAMAAAMYCSFLMFFFFGVVPDRWRVYSAGSLGMRSDAILAGPGSTGWLTNFPVVISKAIVSDLVTVNLYMVGLVTTFKVWGIWQARGSNVSDEVETSTYGRPLVKS